MTWQTGDERTGTKKKLKKKERQKKRSNERESFWLLRAPNKTWSVL